MPLSLNVKIFTKISDWSVVEMNFSMNVLLFLYKYVRTKKKKMNSLPIAFIANG